MPKVGKKTFPYTKSGVAAAKKAASKPPMKKAASKPPAKKAARTKSDENDIRTFGHHKGNSAEVKGGKEGRGRAKKYGTPVGKTYAWQTPGTNEVSTRTVIKSARGNKYDLTENQTLKKMGPNKVTSGKRPDVDRSSTAVYKDFGLGNYDSYRTRAPRDPKFGPAPKTKKKKK